MKFNKTLKRLKAGECVRRLKWKEGAYVYLDENLDRGKFVFYTVQGLRVPGFSLQAEDVLADDWKPANCDRAGSQP